MALEIPYDLLQYVGLVWLGVIVFRAVSKRVEHAGGWKAPTKAATAILGAAIIWTWGYFDTCMHVTETPRSRIEGTYTRFGEKPLYKTVWMRNERGGWESTFEGPTSSDSGKPHGRWHFLSHSPLYSEDTWYWYGEEVTEGEWQLRNRRR